MATRETTATGVLGWIDRVGSLLMLNTLGKNMRPRI